MTDYSTHFSCILDVRTAENATQALALRSPVANALDIEEDLLAFEVERDELSHCLWIYSDGHGEPENVIAFVLACAQAFDLTGRWGFTWALTCSSPCLDGFGGGAQLLDLGERRSLAWLDCAHWLDMVREPSVDPTEGVGIV